MEILIAMLDLPRQLTDFRRLPGMLKDDYEDFIVEEIPLYPFDGAGPHTYVLIEKAGLSTAQAIRDIARTLNVARHNIGFAGQKDSRAITRQWLSIEHLDPDKITSLQIPRLRIVETTRHRNKLRLGHLKGNTFTIRIRETDLTRAEDLQVALNHLHNVGVPNYFAEQRFGYRGDTWAIGRALIHNQPTDALDLILGRPSDVDHGPTLRARRLYDQQKYAEAANTWPHMFHAERQAATTLAKTGGNARKALSAIDRSMRTFYISAYQSYLFNHAIAARLPTGLGKLLDGDLAWRHANGAVFLVTDPEHEQPRADSFEISPSGPLFGYRMTQPEGQPGQIEHDLLANEQLSLQELAERRPRVRGGRRPLRFQPSSAKVQLGADPRGPYLELRFSLPRGCYATALLRETFDFASRGQSPNGDTGTEEDPPVDNRDN